MGNKEKDTNLTPALSGIDRLSEVNRLQQIIPSSDSPDTIPQTAVSGDLVNKYPDLPFLNLEEIWGDVYQQLFYEYRPSIELFRKERKRLYYLSDQSKYYDEQVQFISEGLVKAYGIPEPKPAPNTVRNGYVGDLNHILSVGYTVNDKKDPKLWGMYQKDRATHTSLTGPSGSGKQIFIKYETYKITKDKNSSTLEKYTKTPLYDIKVGDYILNEDGLPTKVLDISPLRNAINGTYKLTKKDHTSIICDGDHLWTVLHGKKSKGYKQLTATTEEIYKLLEENKSSLASGARKYSKRYYLPVMKRVEFSEKDLPVDPWVLGFLIGDGCMRDPDMLTFSTADVDFIPQKMQERLGTEYIIRKTNPSPKNYSWSIQKQAHRVDGRLYNTYLTELLEEIQDLELMGKHSYNKFIPEMYKFGSAQQRLDLIQGLMDADGSARKGRYSFSTISKQLADDFCEIVRGLGYSCRVRIDNRPEKYPHSDGKAYDISIWTNDPELVSLPRKRKSLQDYINAKSKMETYNRKPIKKYSAEEYNEAVDEHLSLHKGWTNKDISLIQEYAWAFGHFLFKGKKGSPNAKTLHSIYLSLKNESAPIFDRLPEDVVVSETKQSRPRIPIFRFYDSASPYKNWKNYGNTIAEFKSDIPDKPLFIDRCIDCGCVSDRSTRLIPEFLMRSSKEVRESLLEGILAEQGRIVSGHKEIQLNGISDDFRNQIIRLIDELGYHYLSSIQGKKTPSHILTVYSEKDTDERIVDDDIIEIIDIERLPDDDSQLFRCIRVDSPTGLFVVGDGFFVTHNSTFIHQLITQDIWFKRGGVLLDPHGDLAESSLSVVPPYRIPKTVFIDMADEEYAPGLNPLYLEDYSNDNERQRAIENVMDLMSKFFNMESSAVQLKKNLEAALNALSWVPGATILEVLDFFNNQDVQETVLSFIPDDLIKKESIVSVAQSATAETLGSLENRISAFVNNQAMSLTFGQSIPTLDMFYFMNNEYTVLFKMSKGNMGEGLFRFYGAYIISLVYRAALKRAVIPEPDRKFFTLYVDEFFNFMTGDIDKMLTELRKYALQMFLAYQNMAQISDKAISAAIDNSCRTKIVYKLGAEDAGKLHKSFLGTTAADLMNIKRYHILASPLVKNENLAPFVSKVMPPLVFNSPLSLIDSQVIIENTRKQFMLSRKEIDEQIKTRKQLYASHNPDAIYKWWDELKKKK